MTTCVRKEWEDYFFPNENVIRAHSHVFKNECEGDNVNHCASPPEGRALSRLSQVPDLPLMNNFVTRQLDPLSHSDIKNPILINSIDKISLDMDFVLLS